MIGSENAGKVTEEGKFTGVVYRKGGGSNSIRFHRTIMDVPKIKWRNK